MVTLRYSREEKVASGSYAEIRVKDTGPGIPMMKRRRSLTGFTRSAVLIP